MLIEYFNCFCFEKNTIQLSKFSLQKRINTLKKEWWYWDDIMQATLINGISTEDNDTEEILQLLTTNPSELI